MHLRCIYTIYIFVNQEINTSQLIYGQFHHKVPAKIGKRILASLIRLSLRILP